MAKEFTPGYEIPPEMRALAEKSMEQARQAFEGFLSAAQQAASTAGSQFATAQSGAREAGALALQFAERNVANSFEFARKLARANDAQEVMALHAEYAQSQIAALTEQAKELSQRAAKMGGKATGH